LILVLFFNKGSERSGPFLYSPAAGVPPAVSFALRAACLRQFFLFFIFLKERNRKRENLHIDNLMMRMQRPRPKIKSRLQHIPQLRNL
jgi:hypothetical protein